MKQKAIITYGLPGSGKSTWARELQEKNPGVYKRANNDELRNLLDNGKWSDSNEKFMRKILNTIIAQAIEDGKSVIVDNTNLNPKTMSKLQEFISQTANRLGKEVEIEVKDFTNVSAEECIARDAKRTHGHVGKKVIMDMYNKFVYKPISPPPEVSGPRAIIVDIDGTLAIHQGRSPYEYDRVKEDKLDESVARISMSMRRQGFEVIILSGRDGACEKDTREWLAENEIEYDAFFMRPAGDMRNDTIIKNEIYEREIKGKYNVLFALDDRNRIVDLWRSLGIKCLQVAYGDF